MSRNGAQDNTDTGAIKWNTDVENQRWKMIGRKKTQSKSSKMTKLCNVTQNEYTKQRDTTAVQQPYTMTTLDNILHLHLHTIWYEEEEEETVGNFVAALCDVITGHNVIISSQSCIFLNFPAHRLRSGMRPGEAAHASKTNSWRLSYFKQITCTMQKDLQSEKKLGTLLKGWKKIK